MPVTGSPVRRISLHDLFDLLGDLRNCLAYRPADVIGNRNAANFRQMLIDHYVAAVGADKSQTDRRRLVRNELEFRRTGQRFQRIVIE